MDEELAIRRGKSMTGRQRILNALRQQEVDRIPWIPLCSRTFFVSIPEYNRKFPYKWWQSDGGLPKDLRLEELKFRIEFFRKIGADFLSWGGGEAVKVKYNKTKEQFYRKGSKILIGYETPIGNLTWEYSFSSESQTLFINKYLMEDIHDYKIYKYILEDMEFTENYQNTRELLDIIGEDGVIFHSYFQFPLQSWIMELLGTEKSILGLADNKKEIKEIIRVQDKNNHRAAQIVASSPLQIFNYQSAWGLGRISPSIFKEYYLSYYKVYNNMLHNHNKITIDHLSGLRVRHYLELLEDTKLDGLYGFTFPVLSGELSLSEITERWRNRMVCMGGLDPHFMATATKNKVKDRTKQILEAMSGKPNFILGSADDIVYGTPVENLEVVSEVVRSFYR